MGACSSYLYELLQGLPIQACIVLQELELLQLELVPRVGLCLLLQQLEHHSTEEEIKEIPQYQQWSPSDLPVGYCEEGHASAAVSPCSLLTRLLSQDLHYPNCPEICTTLGTLKSHTGVPSNCARDFSNRKHGYHAYTK